MSKSQKQLKGGVILSYLSIVLNILIGLIYTPWMISQIGQNQYGLYTLANSLISLFILDFGLGATTTRYLSKLHAEGDEEGVNNFLGVVYKLYAIIDSVILIVFILIYFMIDIIYTKLTPEELEQFKVVYIIAAGFSVVNFPFVTLNGIMTAYEKFIPLKLADVIYRLSLTILMIVALLMGYGLYALVVVHAFVGLLLIIYKLIVIYRKTPIKINFKYNNKDLYKEIFSFSLWSTVAALSQRLIFSITPSILGSLVGAASVAVFGIVTTIEGYVYMITNAINGLFMPRIARIYSKEDANQNISSLLLKVGRFQYGLEGLIIAVFIVLGKDFITLWMGEEYIDAYYGILLVLIPGIFFNSLNIANTAAVMKKHVRNYASVIFMTGLINVVLSLVFSRIWGMIGACISIFVAYSFRAVTLCIYYNKKLKIDIKGFVRKCYFKLSFPIIITVILGILLDIFIPLQGWIGFLVTGILLVVIYFFVLISIGFDDPKKVVQQMWSFFR